MPTDNDSEPELHHIVLPIDDAVTFLRFRNADELIEAGMHLVFDRESIEPDGVVITTIVTGNQSRSYRLIE